MMSEVQEEYRAEGGAELPAQSREVAESAS